MNPLYEAISAACANASAIGLRARLIPAAGLDEDQSFFLLPPTYADLGHLLSPVREDGSHAYVLVDSPQSWANRLEEIADDPACGLPRLVVRVAGQSLSLHQLPHRVYDAILRDAEVDGLPFRASPVGRALVEARPDNASALLRHAPAVLLFGGWDSFSGQGTAGAKFPAALSGQILGFDALPTKKAGVRIDPLGIKLESFQGWESVRPGEMWTDNKADAVLDSSGKPVIVAKPSEVGHGNIPAGDKKKGTPFIEKGVWVSAIELRSALSLTRLRRYRFPVDGQAEAAADHAGRVLLAVLAVRLQAERLARGLDLRAGCELDASDARWTLRAPLVADQALDVTPATAAEAWQAARTAAEAHGIGFAADLECVASARLESLANLAAA